MPPCYPETPAYSVQGWCPEVFKMRLLSLSPYSLFHIPDSLFLIRYSSFVIPYSLVLIPHSSLFIPYFLNTAYTGICHYTVMPMSAFAVIRKFPCWCKVSDGMAGRQSQRKAGQPLNRSIGIGTSIISLFPSRWHRLNVRFIRRVPYNVNSV